MIERDQIPELQDVDRKGRGRGRLEDHLGSNDWIRQTSIDFWERVRLISLGATAGVLAREVIVRLFS